jgi:hypothetical protein
MKVSVSLRSRREHKAWGVSPRFTNNNSFKHANAGSSTRMRVKHANAGSSTRMRGQARECGFKHANAGERTNATEKSQFSQGSRPFHGLLILL